MDPLTLPDSLSLISAPMVNQSDLPFRLLTRKHGATLTYTQMLDPHRLVNDPEYLEFHLRDLEFCRGDELGRPVVVQLYGNDPEVVVKGARKVERLCDAIGVLLLGGYVLVINRWVCEGT
jgi:tRNA-dihydrouridine synthase 1